MTMHPCEGSQPGLLVHHCKGPFPLKNVLLSGQLTPIDMASHQEYVQVVPLFLLGAGMPIVDVFSRVKKEKRNTLTEVESMELLRQAGITVVETWLARIKKDALHMSREAGFPVVMKIVSPDIPRKSEMGGVKLGIRNEAHVQKAFDEIMEAVRVKHPKARVHGIAIQPTLPPAPELSLGMAKSRDFGPVLTFGLSGALMELLNGVSYRVVPLSKLDATQMLQECKSYPLLQGHRNGNPVNIPAIEDTLLKLSKLVEKNPAIHRLTIDPLFAYRDRAVVVDARIILEEQGIPVSRSPLRR
jgi:acyl-CoA synthetase (NDP forming)